MDNGLCTESVQILSLFIPNFLSLLNNQKLFYKISLLTYTKNYLKNYTTKLLHRIDSKKMRVLNNVIFI